MEITNVNHICFSVSDLNTSIQFYKDIVDDNVLTMFVTTDNQDEVEAFAKKLHYKIEHLSPLTKKEFEDEKAKDSHYRLEHVDHYLN